MKHGLVLGLDGVGKTLLLRQLACHLHKRRKGVREKLAAFATSVSSVAGLSSSYFASATGADSGPDLADPTKSVDTARRHHSSNPHQVRRHHHHHYDHHVTTSAATAATTVTTSVSLETQPTVGVEHTSLPLEARGAAAVMCEVGAQLLPMWKAYFASCDFWVFVLDISNAAQVAGSVVEFFNVLSHDAMRRKPKLLVLNKADASFALDDALLRSYLQLDRLMTSADSGGRLLHIVKVSAVTGENLDAIVKWLNQRCSGSATSTSSSSGVRGGGGGGGITTTTTTSIRRGSISRASSTAADTATKSSPRRHH